MVPVDGGPADGALGLLSAVGDAFAGRRLGFGRRRAAIAAAFARHRGAAADQIAASWVAAALAELGLVRVPVSPDTGEHARELLLADAPLYGAHLLTEIGLPAAAADIVRWHCEHFDGTGTPDRLRWDGIPADAAALGIVHAFTQALENPEEPRHVAEALFALVAENGRRFSVELVRAFREFVLLRPQEIEDAGDLPLPALDDDAILVRLAGWIDARDDRTRGRSERLAAIAAPLAARIGLDGSRAARLMRLHALGRAAQAVEFDAYDPLSRFAHDRRLAEARRAAALAATAARYAIDAELVAASAVWYEEGAVDRYSGVLALALAVDLLDPLEQPRRVAAAAGSQFDPELARAYLDALAQGQDDGKVRSS
ncbi:MAG TPA: HD domain-containing phosphohydrolase [Candidatus Acidoferrum sp.]|nr:HD domain-containing phosphohydrolase [Candidatus Acidoferrum sp.]